MAPRAHTFRPDPDDPTWCECGLPARNTVAHTDPPTVPDISEARNHADRPLPAPAQLHSATSVQAAMDMAPHLTGWQQKVLTVLAAAGLRGMTEEELIHRVDPDKANTIRPRRIELEKAGLVAKLRDQTGGEVTRRNRSGRSAAVYVATPAGRERAA